MQSLKELYRIGFGPSASHTMGPRAAAEQYRARYPDASAYHLVLFGSLAATGRGHLTDRAVEEVFADRRFSIDWRSDTVLPFHPNGMHWSWGDGDGCIHDVWEVYSVGGGALHEAGDAPLASPVYPMRRMEDWLAWCRREHQPLWQVVFECEGEDALTFLREVWEVMQDSRRRGLESDGLLPGPLRVPRKAQDYYHRAMAMNRDVRKVGRLSAYALAVSEENASGGRVVAAPTCGSCGILPAVLSFLVESLHCTEELVVKALATAGLVGNLVKTNASISGAEVGCQGEVGTACAMAAAAAACMLGGTSEQIEYAAEMGIEHHLGLTCDPVLGMVQIPCIERNAVAATRALDCASYALLSDGRHRISFDAVVDTMRQTGHDMQAAYKETSEAGLAKMELTREDAD
ncbi:MAG: L-serine ammonia-lyase [Planctomycetota bacterium]